jgi:hypothetical protein
MTEFTYEQKMAAQRAVAAAVRRGELTRPLNCEQCGQTSPRPLDGHHDDYSKPLSVRWLCHRCHKQHHGRLTRERNAGMAMAPPMVAVIARLPRDLDREIELCCAENGMTKARFIKQASLDLLASIPPLFRAERLQREESR